MRARGVWARWLPGALVAALTVLTFLPSLQGEFVNWDDDENFLFNPHYRGLGWTQIRWMFTATHSGLYIPVTWLTLGLDHVLWGMDPRGYHLTSLVLHALNATLFYLLARRLLATGLAAPPGAVSWGRVMITVVPWPTVDRTRTLPPCIWTARYTSARPIPLPSGLVV